jgi:hypothetical protein
MALRHTQVSLLEQAQAGSEQALLQILELTSTFVAHMAQSLLARDPRIGADGADSAASAALFKVHKAILNRKFIHPGRDQHAFHPYVSVIVQNCFRDEGRKRARAGRVGDPEVRPFPADEEGRPLDVPDDAPGPAELAEQADRKELNHAWCLAVALQALSLARSRYVQPGAKQDPELLLLAWQGYCLMTFESLARAEILERLRAYPSAEKLGNKLTVKWLDTEAHKIRVLNAQCFLEMCREVKYEVTHDAMREGLDALAGGMRLEKFKGDLQRAAEGEDVTDLVAQWCERAAQRAKFAEQQDAELRLSSQRLRSSAAALSRVGGVEP